MAPRRPGKCVGAGGYATSAVATHTNDATSRPSDTHLSSSSGRVSQSAPTPPRAVARFHAVVSTAIARTTPLAANNTTPTARTPGVAAWRTGTTRVSAPRPAVHAITWQALSRNTDGSMHQNVSDSSGTSSAITAGFGGLPMTRVFSRPSRHNTAITTTSGTALSATCTPRGADAIDDSGPSVEPQ